MGDALEDERFFRVTRDDGLATLATFQCILLAVQAQTTFDLRLVRAMTSVAILGENRLDLRIEIHLIRPSDGGK